MLTDGSHNLCLHAILVLETTGKVADAATAIGSDVGDFPDVVEHVAAGEQQDRDQADGSPDVAILDDGEDIWPCDKCRSQTARQADNGNDPFHPVDRPLDRRVRAVGQMASEPGVHLLSSLGAEWLSTAILTRRYRVQLLLTHLQSHIG